MRVWLVILILLGRFSSGAAEIGCEGEINPKALVLVNYTRALLQRQALSAQDVQFMTDGGELRNPYSIRARVPENLDLSNGLARAIHAVRGSEAAAIKELRKLIVESERQETQVANTNAYTRSVLAPQRLTQLLGPGDPIHRKLHWHRDANGKLSLATYFPYERSLRLFSTRSSTPRVERQFVPQDSSHPKVMESSDMLSLPNGRLFVAGSSFTKGIYKIFVHDVDSDKTYETDFPEQPEFLRLFENSSGQVQLLAVYGDTISYFKIGEEISAEGSTRIGAQIRSVKLLTNGAGRTGLEVLTKHSIHLIDLRDGATIRRFSTRATLIDVKSTFVGAHDYAILVVQEFGLITKKFKVEFITSKITDPVFVAETDTSIKVAEWQVTRSGRALAALAMRDSLTRATVAVYEPLTSDLTSKWKFDFIPRRQSSIMPTKTFNIAAIQDVHQLEFLETATDVLIAARGFYFQVLSVNTDNPALSGEIYEDFRLFHLENRVIVLSKPESRPIRVYDLPHEVKVSAEFRGALKFSTPLVYDQNGDLLFASDNAQTPRRNRMVEIFRIVKGDDGL